jgi:hypothetical protein
VIKLVNTLNFRTVNIVQIRLKMNEIVQVQAMRLE